jgi:hypothetical protein
VAEYTSSHVQSLVPSKYLNSTSTEPAARQLPFGVSICHWHLSHERAGTVKIEIAAILSCHGPIRILELAPAFVRFVELAGINLTQFNRRFFAFKVVLAKFSKNASAVSP